MSEKDLQILNEKPMDFVMGYLCAKQNYGLLINDGKIVGIEKAPTTAESDGASAAV